MENDSYIFLQKIAKALILRALFDLKKNKKTYTYTTAKNFCLGVDKVWEDSLKTWCELANVSPKSVKHKAMEYINANRSR